MESLIIPKFNSFESFSLNQKMCYSPTSNFGSDFNNLVEIVLNKQTVYEKPKMEEIDKTGHKNEGEPVTMKLKQKMKNKVKMDTKRQVKNDCVNIREAKLENEECSVTSASEMKSEINNNALADKDKKKKKKWKAIPVENLGFNFSLFPRPVKDSVEIDENAKDLHLTIENELEKFETMCAPFEKLQEFEGHNSDSLKYLRADRDRKIRKVHQQVKDKYCRNVKNNKGRKTVYIHHRLSKLISLDIQSLSYLPSKRKNVTLNKSDIKRSAPVYQPNHKNRDYVAPVAKPQCLAHALDTNNLPGDFDNQIASLLISLQHRDLTPEDYDVLLRLDERVAPKTVSENTLAQFKTEKVEHNDEGEVCPVCMEVYLIGQVRKYLPCEHVFHSDCIDMWLQNSSMNCPIDNLPIEPS